MSSKAFPVALPTHWLTVVLAPSSSVGFKAKNVHSFRMSILMNHNESTRNCSVLVFINVADTSTVTQLGSTEP
jgi:hypothetical protein